MRRSKIQGTRRSRKTLVNQGRDGTVLCIHPRRHGTPEELRNNEDVISSIAAMMCKEAAISQSRRLATSAYSSGFLDTPFRTTALYYCSFQNSKDWTFFFPLHLACFPCHCLVLSLCPQTTIPRYFAMKGTFPAMGTTQEPRWH